MASKVSFSTKLKKNTTKDFQD